tara:strand:- start:2806 stop:3006 length:201 start_codon:yes stop_codon:yes gene_type:complete
MSVELSKEIHRVLNLKEDILDCVLSDFPEDKREKLLNEILLDYLGLIDEKRISQLENIIVNQFEEI